VGEWRNKGVAKDWGSGGGGEGLACLLHVGTRLPSRAMLSLGQVFAFASFLYFRLDHYDIVYYDIDLDHYDLDHYDLDHYEHYRASVYREAARDLQRASLRHILAMDIEKKSLKEKKTNNNKNKTLVVP
jgi:hypothetical protein